MQLFLLLYELSYNKIDKEVGGNNMYVERKPSLYLEDLRTELKNSLNTFKNSDEGYDILVGFVELDHNYTSELIRLNLCN